MERNSSIDSRIDEKENALIVELSGRISDSVEKIIKKELEQNILEFAYSVSDAENKTSAMSRIIERLSETLTAMEEYNIPEQCRNLSAVNEKIADSSENVYRTFSESSNANIKFIDDITKLTERYTGEITSANQQLASELSLFKNEFDKIKNEYVQTVETAEKAGKTLTENIDSVNREAAELKKLLNEINQIIPKLNEKSSEVTQTAFFETKNTIEDTKSYIEKSIDDTKYDLNRAINETKNEIDMLSERVDNLKKTPAISILTSVIAVIILALQLFMYFK